METQYTDDVMITMYKKSLHDNEEHKKWLQEMLSHVDEKHKPYFRLQYNLTKAHIKMITAELSSYKNQDFFTKELAVAWENLGVAIDNLREYLDDQIKTFKDNETIKEIKAMKDIDEIMESKNNKLKWYDWIPIVGIFTTAYRDVRVPISEFEICAYIILQLGSLTIGINLLSNIL